MTEGGGYKVAEGMKAKDNEWDDVRWRYSNEVAEGINSFACQGTVSSWGPSALT